MIRIGVVGIGFMGMVHYLSYQKIADASVTSIVSRDAARRAGDWTGIRGNFGPPGQQMDLSGVSTHETLDGLLADDQIDLVDLCLPPALHADAAIAALEAGKHVFCEKPMALSVEDCERMAAAARASGCRLLIGHVLPFFPEYDWARRVIESGEHGRVVGGSFRRVISDPAWLDNYWDAGDVGGPMLDLHVHDAHYIRLLFGPPATVTTRGSARGQLAEHWHSLLEFDNGCAVHVEGGVVNHPGRPFLHGFEITLENATLVFEFAVTETDQGPQAAYHCPPTLLTSSGKAQRVPLGDGDPMQAFEHELRRVVDVLRGAAQPGPLAADLAVDAIEICQRQTNSLLAAASPVS